ncbi:MAG: TonB-dependent receptor [Bacteroidetes bacterium]|nr:TonB-dependent receptor [Bacteroidota bacterium]
MKLFFVSCFCLIVSVFNNLLLAQAPDSTYVLKEVIVTGNHMNGIGWLNDFSGQTIYSGMKNEVLEIDSLDANKAINNTRQIIGRIPGVNITENEMGGFTANGISFRGLNPYQSIETNTRQNGYNISADLYGYNEAYYLPPMEAVKSITILRDGAALAFGPQLGGMVNYELKDGSPQPVSITSSQTGGSYGLFNSFNSIGGTINNFKYYGFLQYRRLEGWRANSQQTQWSGFASLEYNPTDRLQIGIEYTMLRNLIRMPGGLNDSLFYADPQQSLRSRNWLDSPWNILSAHINYKFNDKASVSFISSYLLSQRNLIWRNEDGGPAAIDSITSSLTYIPRELEREYFNTFTNELRFLSNYNLLGEEQTFSFGLRAAYSHLIRRVGADGTTGTDFDLTQLSPWEQDMNFYTTNIAPYLENIFHITDALSITPGLRLEYLSTKADGYAPNKAGDSGNEYVYANNKKSTSTFLLGSVSAELKASDNTNFYLNLSQSYRPITYSDLTPFGSIAKIDQNLKDASAYDIDFGFRGIVGSFLNFDVSFFYMHVKNDIGIIEQTYDTLTYQFKTNTGADDHKGMEMYAELNLLGGLIPDNEFGRLGIYNSFGYTEARYVSGEYNGNYVPYAPKYTNRLGIDYSLGAFSMNIQHSYTAASYGDPANTNFSPDGLVGIIPSYSVIDISAAYKISDYEFRFGVNNLTNKKYFTMRTDEYPGPGIIPSIGRMIYAGISLNISGNSKNY